MSTARTSHMASNEQLHLGIHCLASFVASIEHLPSCALPRSRHNPIPSLCILLPCSRHALPCPRGPDIPKHQHWSLHGVVQTSSLHAPLHTQHHFQVYNSCYLSYVWPSLPLMKYFIIFLHWLNYSFWSSTCFFVLFSNPIPLSTKFHPKSVGCILRGTKGVSLVLFLAFVARAQSPKPLKTCPFILSLMFATSSPFAISKVLHPNIRIWQNARRSTVPFDALKNFDFESQQRRKWSTCTCNGGKSIIQNIEKWFACYFTIYGVRWHFIPLLLAIESLTQKQ